MNTHPNATQIDSYLLDKFSVLFADKPDAANFVTLYRDYIHHIDDLIDNEHRPTPEEVLKTFAKASGVFSSFYWRNNAHLLLVVEQLSNNTYADSVIWEQQDDVLLARDAAALRHTGIDMFFAVILIEFGRDKLREISADFREHCHRMHMTKEGVPV